LKSQVLEIGASPAGVGSEAGEVRDALVRQLPARPQVEPPQLLEPPGNIRQPPVGYIAAAAQLQLLQVPQVVRDLAQRVVGNRLAQRHVQVGERRQVGGEGAQHGGVVDMEAAAEVEGLQRGQRRQGLPEPLLERQHLNPPDAPVRQAAEHAGVGAPQVELGFDASPHRLVVGGVPPRRAHLRRPPAVLHAQVREDEGQQLGVQTGHMRPLALLLLLLLVAQLALLLLVLLLLLAMAQLLLVLHVQALEGVQLV